MLRKLFVAVAIVIILSSAGFQVTGEEIVIKPASEKADQNEKGMTYDDDEAIGWYWDPATGDVDHYSILASRYIEEEAVFAEMVFIGEILNAPTENNPYYFRTNEIEGIYRLQVGAENRRFVGLLSEISEPVKRIKVEEIEEKVDDLGIYFNKAPRVEGLNTEAGQANFSVEVLSPESIMIIVFCSGVKNPQEFFAYLELDSVLDAQIEQITKYKDQGNILIWRFQEKLAMRVEFSKAIIGSFHLASFKIKIKPGAEKCFIALRQVQIKGEEGTSRHEVVKEIRLVPQYYDVLQNYPNPFYPETWIPFTLRRDINLRVQIYTEYDQLMKTFNLGMKSAGYYIDKEVAVHWDGKDQKGKSVPPGIYFANFIFRDPRTDVFYRVMTGKKMVKRK